MDIEYLILLLLALSILIIFIIYPLFFDTKIPPKPEPELDIEKILNECDYPKLLTFLNKLNDRVNKMAKDKNYYDMNINEIARYIPLIVSPIRFENKCNKRLKDKDDRIIEKNKLHNLSRQIYANFFKDVVNTPVRKQQYLNIIF